MSSRNAGLTLRSRLLTFLSWPLLILLGISVVADYRSAVNIAADAYDSALTSTAVALATRLERDDDDLDIEVDVPPAADEILRTDAVDEVRYVVFDSRDKVVAGDAKLLVLPRPEVANRAILQDAVLDRKKVRVASYLYQSEHLQATVIVTETTLKRQRAANRILAMTFWPNLLMITSALLLVYFGVRVALKPLDRLGREIAGRGGMDFRPLVEAEVPGEARPLVRAINRLMGSLDRAGQSQQAFLSNAAHQLRTPLAGLQTQLDLAADAVPEAERPRIRQLQEASQRLAHFTHQMLALARSSSEGALIGDHRPVELGSLLEEAASDLLDAALAKGIDLGFEAEPASVEGSRWMLREMLANLIENAIHYTPAGGRVTVRCGRCDGGGGFVEVDDDGPGIPEDQREKVLERFYRLPGSAGKGTGLGLAIVKEVADRHGAELDIGPGSDGRGTRVRVGFPPDVVLNG